LSNINCIKEHKETEKTTRKSAKFECCKVHQNNLRLISLSAERHKMIPTTVNKDINEEREKVTFSVEELCNWYHGGAAKVAEKRAMGKESNATYFLNIIIFMFHRKVFLERS